MTPVAPEFSRLVTLAQLSTRPFRQRIEATLEERERLSRRLDLISLDRLVAEVELRRQSPEVILLEAEFAAEFEQCCAVTLEPVRGAVADRFSLVYGPAPKEEQEIALSTDEPAFTLTARSKASKRIVPMLAKKIVPAEIGSGTRFR